MKYLKYIFVLLLSLAVLPFAVNAEAKPDAEIKDTNEVKVYLFRGEGCPHCEEAIEWFNSIEKEYGSKFQLISYETWYNEDNQKLLDQVGKTLKQEISGVPFIIIGQQNWSGFSSNMEKAILAEIDAEYSMEPSERFDIMEHLVAGEEESTEAGFDSTSFIVLVVAVIVIGAIMGIVYINKKKEA